MTELLILVTFLATAAIGAPLDTLGAPTHQRKQSQFKLHIPEFPEPLLEGTSNVTIDCEVSG